MLVDVKPDITNPRIQELIGYSVFPDPESVIKATNKYLNNEDQQLFGYRLNDEILGIVGFKIHDKNMLEMLHISILPEARGNGMARVMISEIIEEMKPKGVIAETDQEAVDFYRNIGFIIESVGEKYPGVERFQCTFETDF